MNEYELQQLDEIEAWENRRPGAIAHAAGFMTKPVAWAVKKAIPSKIIESAILACDHIAVTLTDRRRLLREARVTELAELRSGSLEQCDRLASKVQKWAVGVAAGEGGVAGATGMVGMVADIPALITMAYRLIYHIALCYGYECRGEADRMFVNGIMAAAGANSSKEKLAAVTTLRELYTEIADLTWNHTAEMAAQKRISHGAVMHVINSLAQQLGVNLSRKKAMQVLPAVGAVVGATMNASFIQDVGWAARRAFQRRWLTDNGLISNSKD